MFHLVKVHCSSNKFKLYKLYGEGTRTDTLGLMFPRLRSSVVAAAVDGHCAVCSLRLAAEAW